MPKRMHIDNIWSNIFQKAQREKYKEKLNILIDHKIIIIINQSETENLNEVKINKNRRGARI